MSRCRECGGKLVPLGEHDGSRSFQLFRCPSCDCVGGHASGAGLPDEAWGPVEVPKGGEV